MNKLISALSFTVFLALPFAAQAQPPYQVTSGANDGPGTLREALASGATRIIIKPNVAGIVVTESLVYTGTAPLTVTGSGQTIDGSGLTDKSTPIFAVTAGADLSLSNLSFDGGGGYSIENQGGGKGIFVDVPLDREGMVTLDLHRVSVFNTGNHGIHVSDCTEGDDCGGGQGGGGDGSTASIYVSLVDVLIDGVGFGKQDADGLRVDDRNDGDIYLSATNSRFVNVGADGIELDEGNAGSVIVNVRNSVFNMNGAYCSDELADVPIADEVLLILDPKCDDDGEPDVDDAFDIDEAGPGGISGIVRNLTLIDNFDEGLDFDSEGEGPDNLVDLTIVDITASGNADEAIKVSEEGGASVIVSLRALDIEGDVEVEEEDEGDLRVFLRGSVIGDDLKLSEDGTGEGTAKIRGSTIGDELDFNNIDSI